MPEQRLHEARESLRRGRIDEVDALCDGILASHADHGEALYLKGLAAVRRSDWLEAEHLVGKALRLHPTAAILRLHGHILCRLERPAEALDDFDRARALAPDIAEEPAVVHARARALQRLGRLAQALAAIEDGIRGAPDDAQGHAIHAALLAALERFDDALAAADTALGIRPELVDMWILRGDCLFARRRFRLALEAFDNALGRIDEAGPDYPGLLLKRADTLRALGRVKEALTAYDACIARQPEVPEFHLNRGNLLLLLGRRGKALAAYEQAIRCRPSYAKGHANRGNVLRALGRDEEALAAYDEAIRLRPRFAEAYHNRSSLLHRTGRVQDALADAEHAIGLNADYAEAHAQRGNILMDQGRLVEARQAYRTALAVRSDLSEVRSNYLLCLHCDPDLDETELLEAAREWGRRYAGKAPSRPHGNTPDPGRTLHVGLVSADFGRHPTGYLLDGVLAHADRDQVRFYGYDCSRRNDDVTRRLRSNSHAWRVVVRHPPRALSELIRRDGIDILIDLSGHTGGNRLTCFALKPAPLQVTWLGSPFTTGVPAMDYILMDPVYAPPGSERWFTETVVRLPRLRWVYSPPPYAPDVADPPVSRRGYITFGSSHYNLAKLNDRVIALWTRLLAAVPDARLVISSNTLQDQAERERLRGLFAAQGVDPARVEPTPGAGKHGSWIASDERFKLELRPKEGRHVALLNNYRDVDIVLDTFPVSGGVSSCEALWMGVPVVTLPGPRPASRQTLGFLTALQRTEWAAASEDDYIRIAVNLASDPRALTEARRAQRERMLNSPLCDGEGFAAELVDTLRQLWVRWCAAAAAHGESGDEGGDNGRT